MSDAFFDKMIADLKEGAARSEGFMRGGRVGIEVSREHRGTESKLASIPGVMGGGALGALGGGLGGGLAGAGTGALLGKLLHLDPHAAQELGAVLGVGGAGLGAAGGMFAGGAAGKDDPSMLQRLKGGALEQHYAEGTKAAANHFGVKEALLGALLPMAGSVLGGTAARAGLGAMAGRGGGRMAGMAGKALGFANKGGIQGAAFDQAAGMAGGMIGNRLAGPPQQQ